MAGTFSIMDWVVFAGTLVVSVLIGLYYAFIKKQRTNAELLVGGRNMAIFPSTMSLLATYMSAILVLGFAGEIYAHGSIIAEMIFGALFYIPLGGLIFLPTLYNLKLTSVYEYLEIRFDSHVVRLLATATFITQIVLYMGVVLFAPALALKAVVDFPVDMTMFVIGLCAAVYTSIGGIKAVVWTDVFQIMMMLAGMLAIIIQGSIRLGGFGKAFTIANEHNRIQFLDLTVDPFLRHSTLNLFFGTGLWWLSSFGCHQTTVQRYCSMSTLKRAFWALLLTAPFVAVTMSFAVMTGIVIFANYAGCDPLTLGLIKKKDQIAPYFVLEFLSPITGLMGLFIACLFSGSLSTISSGINSLAACTWEDFLKNISFFKNMSEGRQGIVTKIIGFIYGIITIGMGFVASKLGGVLQAAIVVNGAVAGPLLGVFLVGVLVPFVNKYGAIVGMILAHICTFWVAAGGLLYKKAPETLNFEINACSNETLLRVNMTEALERQTMMRNVVPEEFEWPARIYQLSHVLYPFIGCTVTIVVGAIVSLFTGPTKLTKELEPCIHPLIVKLNRSLQGKSSKGEIEMTGASHFDSKISITTLNGKSIRDNSYKQGYDNTGYNNS
ncbi:unnamed protein product [Allacma fusca]|uniref:Sodium-coupled monocarboxylate transporter 1 n=1 Tax=Allacma fusca TaxID=39272 RepID=A0A8J2L5G2_9HEXA|nr:unnamed protein product [Allacma fusca]